MPEKIPLELILTTISLSIEDAYNRLKENFDKAQIYKMRRWFRKEAKPTMESFRLQFDLTKLDGDSAFCLIAAIYSYDAVAEALRELIGHEMVPIQKMIRIILGMENGASFLSKSVGLEGMSVFEKGVSAYKNYVDISIKPRATERDEIRKRNQEKGEKTGKKRRESAKPKHESIRKEARAIWDKNENLSVNRVASLIKQGFGYSPQWISKIIQDLKPKGSVKVNK